MLNYHILCIDSFTQCIPNNDDYILIINNLSITLADKIVNYFKIALLTDTLKLTIELTILHTKARFTSILLLTYASLTKFTTY